MIVVHPSVNAKNVQELIALAKSQPGKLNYASSGQGTPYHMAGELFKAMTGTDIVHVPHRNSGEARASVMGGQVEIMIDAVPAMAQNIAAGQVRAIATTGKTRSTVLPDVPTVHEAGVPGYEATIWLGMVAPAGTPKQVVDKLAAEMKGVVGKAREREDVGEPGRSAGVDDASRVRQVPARRHRQVGGRRQADQRERQEVVAVASLKILSGGAAQGLVASVTPKFTSQTGWSIDGTYGAVGIMAAKLREGAPADVMILTAALIASCAGRAVAASSAAIGVVETAVAVRNGDPSPPIADEARVARCVSCQRRDLRAGHRRPPPPARMWRRCCASSASSMQSKGG